MTPITDDFMKQALTTARAYTTIILKKTATFSRQEHAPVLWEHARNNFRLRAEGKLVIVCPVRDDSDVAGLGIFNLSPEATKQVMDEDPGVAAGIFTYDIHPVMSFPGDSLPG